MVTNNVGISGFTIYVLSHLNNFKIEEIKIQIEEFVRYFKTFITEMTEEEFNGKIKMLDDTFLEKKNSLISWFLEVF